MIAKKKKTWKPAVGAKLGGQEILLSTMLRRGTRTVSALYRAIASVPSSVMSPPPRIMQQKIGAIAARFNKKRRGQQIVVGDKPNTYRLRRVR